MHNYKALKSASKVSVRKQDVDGVDILQTVSKVYDKSTGEAQDDKVTNHDISQISSDIESCKSQVAKIQAEQADLEQLETDLKAL